MLGISLSVGVVCAAGGSVFAAESVSAATNQAVETTSVEIKVTDETSVQGAPEITTVDHDSVVIVQESSQVTNYMNSTQSVSNDQPQSSAVDESATNLPTAQVAEPSAEQKPSDITVNAAESAQPSEQATVPVVAAPESIPPIQRNYYGARNIPNVYVASTIVSDASQPPADSASLQLPVAPAPDPQQPANSQMSLLNGSMFISASSVKDYLLTVSLSLTNSAGVRLPIALSTAFISLLLIGLYLVAIYRVGLFHQPRGAMSEALFTFATPIKISPVGAYALIRPDLF